MDEDNLQQNQTTTQEQDNYDRFVSWVEDNYGEENRDRIVDQILTSEIGTGRDFRERMNQMDEDGRIRRIKERIERNFADLRLEKDDSEIVEETQTEEESPPTPQDEEQVDEPVEPETEDKNENEDDSDDEDKLGDKQKKRSERKQERREKQRERDKRKLAEEEKRNKQKERIEQIEKARAERERRAQVDAEMSKYRRPRSSQIQEAETTARKRDIERKESERRKEIEEGRFFRSRTPSNNAVLDRYLQRTYREKRLERMSPEDRRTFLSAERRRSREQLRESVKSTPGRIGQRAKRIRFPRGSIPRPQGSVVASAIAPGHRFTVRNIVNRSKKSKEEKNLRDVGSLIKIAAIIVGNYLKDSPWARGIAYAGYVATTAAELAGSRRIMRGLNYGAQQAKRIGNMVSKDFKSRKVYRRNVARARLARMKVNTQFAEWETSQSRRVRWSAKGLKWGGIGAWKTGKFTLKLPGYADRTRRFVLGVGDNLAVGGLNAIAPTLAGTLAGGPVLGAVLGGTSFGLGYLENHILNNTMSHTDIVMAHRKSIEKIKIKMMADTPGLTSSAALDQATEQYSKSIRGRINYARYELNRNLGHVRDVRPNQITPRYRGPINASVFQGLRSGLAWTMPGVMTAVAMGQNPLIGLGAGAAYGFTNSFLKTRYAGSAMANSFSSFALGAVAGGIIGPQILGTSAAAGAIGGSLALGSSRFIAHKFPKKLAVRGANGAGMGALVGYIAAAALGFNPLYGAALGGVAGGSLSLLRATLLKSRGANLLGHLGAAGGTVLGLSQGSVWIKNLWEKYKYEKDQKGTNFAQFAVQQFNPLTTAGIVNTGYGLALAMDIASMKGLTAKGAAWLAPRGFARGFALATRIPGVSGKLAAQGITKGTAAQIGSRLGTSASSPIGTAAFVGSLIGTVIGIGVGMAMGGNLAVVAATASTGAMIGATVGAVVGGVIGSVVPAAGTAGGAFIGGIAGGAIGGAIGGIVGAKTSKAVRGVIDDFKKGAMNFMGMIGAFVLFSEINGKDFTKVENILTLIFAILTLTQFSQDLQQQLALETDEATRGASSLLQSNTRLALDSNYVYAGNEPVVQGQYVSDGGFFYLSETDYTEKPNHISRTAEEIAAQLEPGFWNFYNHNTAGANWNPNEYEEWRTCNDNINNQCFVTIKADTLYTSNQLIYDTYEKNDIKLKTNSVFSNELLENIQTSGKYIALDSDFDLDEIEPGAIVFFSNTKNDKVFHVGLLYSIEKDFLIVIEANANEVKNYYPLNFEIEESPSISAGGKNIIGFGYPDNFDLAFE